MGKLKISQLKTTQTIAARDIVDIIVVATDNESHRVSLYGLLYDFALDLYGHEKTAKMLVEKYLKK